VISAGLRSLAAPYAQVIQSVVNESRLEVRGLSHESTSCDDLIDDEAGLKCGQLHSLVMLEFVDDDIEDIVRKSYALALALLFENASVEFEAGSSDLDLVWQAAKEGRVHQVFGLEVGGEYHHLLEGYGKALAGV